MTLGVTVERSKEKARETVEEFVKELQLQKLNSKFL